jgi:alcohol dehydrogenase class IV
MRDFPNAAFSPDAIDAMKRAMESAVSHLPEPVSSAHVNKIAESILRCAKDGVRDPLTLERMALLELAITPRN